MIRAVFIIVLAAMVGQATLLLSPTRPVCEESCPDDDARGECTPTCACPICCAHHAPMVIHDGLMVERLPAAQPRHAIASTPLPPSAEASEIFHIPKSLLASI
ncbi:MAG TPA: hypothetical protein VH877_16215 [Polyangia bacterium]|nr:hypothetical protein [Polyangia bacterium]